jgi:hypothetical protein
VLDIRVDDRCRRAPVLTFLQPDPANVFAIPVFDTVFLRPRGEEGRSDCPLSMAVGHPNVIPVAEYHRPIDIGQVRQTAHPSPMAAADDPVPLWVTVTSGSGDAVMAELILALALLAVALLALGSIFQ